MMFAINSSAGLGFKILAVIIQNIYIIWYLADRNVNKYRIVIYELAVY